MADQQRKIAIIQSIEQLQLGTHLIVALEHAQQAEAVANAVIALQSLHQQWN